MIVRYPLAARDFPVSIAVGPNGRLWFPSTFGGAVLRALRPIDKRGRLGRPICFDPSCRLEANGLASDPGGRVWFSARKASSPGGGGMTGIVEDENIANEAGIIGRLAP